MLPATLAGSASLGLLLAAFLGIGLGVLGALRIQPAPIDGFYAVAGGWGVLAAVSASATYLHVPLRLSLLAGLIGGCTLLAVRLWQGPGRALAKPIAVALLALLPALVSAAAFGSVQYDEFGHWLPNALYLFAHDTLPSAALPNLQTGKQGYPIGIPYVTYAVSTIEGAWDDRIPKLVPLLLAGLAAIVLAGAWLGTDWPGVAAIAIAALALTLLNPFLDPRIAVTTYADVPSAFLLAAMAYALLRTLEPDAAARDWVVRAALAALALVQLRETNIALVAAAAASVPLAAMLVRARDAGARERRWRRPLATAAAFVAAPVAAFLLWRLHLAAQGITPDLAPRRLDAWSWSAPGAVLRVLATERLANNPLAGGAALAVGGLLAAGAIAGWRRSDDRMRRLLVMIATLVAAQAGLLAFSYIAVFSDDEVAQAASAWRYASHLGPLLLLAVTLPVAASLQRLSRSGGPVLRRLGARRRLFSGLVLAAVVAAQFAFAGRWRIDCVYPHVRPGYEALVALLAGLQPEAPVAVVNAADPLRVAEMARLARVRATADWRARPPIVVDSPQAVPAGTHAVIVLADADRDRLRAGMDVLRATLHRHVAPPQVESVTVPVSCPGGL